MRCAVVAGLVVMILPAAAIAQTGPYSAVVSAPDVRLRAGPSEKFPETGSVPQGLRVVVDHEEPNGWLAIEAPYGQVSWVSALFVEGFVAEKPTPQLVNVVLDPDVPAGEITLNAGQAGVSEPLQDIRRVKVPQGTILLVTGPKKSVNGKTWFPIAPPLGDFRYIQKTAVQVGSAVNRSFVVRDPGPSTVAAASTAGPGASTAALPPGVKLDPPVAAPPQPPAVNHPLWTQAEAAEKAGRYDDAEKLYFQLAREMNEAGGDHDVANRCYTRIHQLREKKRNAANGTLPPPTTLNRDGGSTSVSTSTAPRPTAGDRPALLPPVRADGTPATAVSSSGDDRLRWSGAGTLTRSALVLDGRQTFALESAPGAVRMYVVGAPDMDLKAYLNRRVDLYGTVSTRKDLSKPYIVVTQVEPSP